MSGCGCGEGIDGANQRERRVLWFLLVINGVMFAVEAVAGWLVESTGLLADSLDMLADATVYGLALYAVGRAPQLKARAAFISGVFQVALALLVAVEVVRRFVMGSEPFGIAMMGVATVALAANVICLALLARYRHGEVHMRASWVFSANDVIANAGVIVAGGLVVMTGSRVPDLVMGLVIGVVVLRGGLTIVADAQRSMLEASADPR